MSKILVIGHSVLDKIFYHHNLTEKPGGIFHSVNTLVNISNDDDEIFLATQYSSELYKHFKIAYDKVNLEYSEVVDTIPTVSLTLYDDKERDEKYSGEISKINLAENINYNMFDIIYVNMISGFDITPDDLKSIRGKSKCKIYFDLHTLSRGFDEWGNRVFRKIDKPQQWLGNIDILQMNVNEKRTILEPDSEGENFGKVFKSGVESVIVTDGGNPVQLISKSERVKIEATKVKSTNFVGCGDTFGAAFCYDYSNNNDIFSALKFANFVAGISTTYNSPQDYKKLREDISERLN